VNCATDNGEKAGAVVQKARIPPYPIPVLIVIIIFLLALMLLLLLLLMLMLVVYELTDCRRRS